MVQQEFEPGCHAKQRSTLTGDITVLDKEKLQL